MHPPQARRWSPARTSQAMTRREALKRPWSHLASISPSDQLAHDSTLHCPAPVLHPCGRIARRGARPAHRGAGAGYRIGSWAADSFGNHRAVVSVDRAAPMAWIDLPWRRPDATRAQKSIWVVDAKTGKRIMNAAHGWITERVRHCSSLSLSAGRASTTSTTSDTADRSPQTTRSSRIQAPIRALRPMALR